MSIAPILKSQTKIACIISAAVATVIDFHIGLSVLLGALTWLIPNQIFCRYFLYDTKRTPQEAIIAFYKGVFLKMISVAVLFAGILKSDILNPAGFFIMFASMQLLFWSLSFKNYKAVLV